MPGRRTHETSPEELAERNAAFVTAVVQELIANDYYLYENDKGSQIEFRIKREPPPLALQVQSGGGRKRAGVREVALSIGGQLLEEGDLESPYSVLSNCVASGLVGLQSRSGWRRHKRQLYRGPVEVGFDGSKRFDAHAALTEISETAPIPNTVQSLYGRVSWKGHLADLRRQQLMVRASQHAARNTVPRWTNGSRSHGGRNRRQDSRHRPSSSLSRVFLTG